MSKRFRVGERVEWNSHGGKRGRAGVAVGKVVERITGPRTVKGHVAKASEADPQYVVETDGGKRAIHKPGALRHRRKR